jgi:hypothetical protein
MSRLPSARVLLLDDSSSTGRLLFGRAVAFCPSLAERRWVLLLSAQRCRILLLFGRAELRLGRHQRPAERGGGAAASATRREPCWVRDS